MKLARLFLAVLTVSTLAACADSVTAPSAESAAKPSLDGATCPVGYTLEEVVGTNGSVTYRCTGTLGSGG
jgi:hypothetical protein